MVKCVTREVKCITRERRFGFVIYKITIHTLSGLVIGVGVKSIYINCNL